MKKLLRIAAIFVVVLILIAVAIPFLVDANQFRPTLEARMSDALGREVKLGDLKLSIFAGNVSASDLTIADDPAFSKEPFLRAKSLGVGVDLMPLITSKKLNVTGITIDQPEVVLLQTLEGKWNFSSLGGKPQPSVDAETKSKAPPPAAPAGPPMELSVKLVKIANGRFTLGTINSKEKERQLDKLNIEVHDFTPSASFPFSFSANVVGGGTIKLDGKAGPIGADDAAKTPLDATLKIDKLDLAGSGFASPATGITGLASIDGHASSDGSVIHVKGQAKAENLRMVKGGSPAKRPIEVDLLLAHNMEKREGRLEGSTLAIGKARAHLTGTYVLTSESPVIKMKLDGPQMPIDELTSILPALDIVLPGGSSIEGGTVTTQFAADGPLDKMAITGTITVDKTKLANYDLGSKLSLAAKLAGMNAGRDTNIDTLSASVKQSPVGTDLQDIKFVAPQIGDLTGAGTISPKHELDFKLKVSLHASGIAALAQNVPVQVSGTSENPSFKADMKAMAGQELKQFSKDPAKAVDSVTQGIKNLFHRSDAKQ